MRENQKIARNRKLFHALSWKESIKLILSMELFALTKRCKQFEEAFHFFTCVASQAGTRLRVHWTSKIQNFWIKNNPLAYQSFFCSKTLWSEQGKLELSTWNFFDWQPLRLAAPELESQILNLQNFELHFWSASIIRSTFSPCSSRSCLLIALLMSRERWKASEEDY